MTLRNLDGVFQPRSVVVVGPNRLGDAALGVLIRNLSAGGFNGPITCVGIPAEQAVPFRAVADLDAIDRADLAVMLTGSDEPAEWIDRIGSKGAKAAVFLGRGYDEWAPELIAPALEAARRHGLRIIGPGSLGISAPHIGLEASLAVRPATKGDLALVSRSGAVINSTVAWAEAHGIGFSSVVSLGQKVDVDIGDLLDQFTADYRTRAVLAHLENISAPVKFMSAARAAARTKPVVVIRSGASRDRRRAGATHSTRLASSDAVYDAAFKRAGLLRVNSIDELFDAVETITRVKPQPCRNVALVANGRSLATIAADHLEINGGAIGCFAEATLEKLAPLVRAGRRPSNPVTLADDAEPAVFAGAIQAALDDPGIDAVLAIHAPNAFVNEAAVAEAVAAIGRAQMKKMGRKKPIITSFLDERVNAPEILHAAGVPCHPTPEEAVGSYGHLVRYVTAQERLMATPPSLPADFTPQPEIARAIVADTIADGRQWLTPVDVRRLLEAYDIPVVPTALARDADEAAALAKPWLASGSRIAVKIAARNIAFKSDVDGVRLGLASIDDVRLEAAEMLERIGASHPEAAIDGVVVMPMIEKRFGIELVAGIADHAIFGPVVVFGRGGTAVEVIADRALDLVPLDLNLARALIGETRVAARLAGYRNRPPADFDAIALTLVKLSQLAADMPEIRELDLNPIVADHTGVVVLDARVRVEKLAERAGRIGNPRLAIRPYPQEWERRLTLKDGRKVLARPVRPEDEALYPDFFTEVTPQDLRLRFFAPIKDFTHAFLSKLTQLDYARAIAFAAIEEASGKLLGVVRLHADPDHRTGEYAILLRSNLKGQGLGWKLMRLIIEWAKADGIETIKGEVLRENATMLDICRALGFSIKSSPDDESIAVVTLPIEIAASIAPDD